MSNNDNLVFSTISFISDRHCVHLCVSKHLNSFISWAFHAHKIPGSRTAWRWTKEQNCITCSVENWWQAAFLKWNFAVHVCGTTQKKKSFMKYEKSEDRDQKSIIDRTNARINLRMANPIYTIVIFSTQILTCNLITFDIMDRKHRVSLLKRIIKWRWLQRK